VFYSSVVNIFTLAFNIFTVLQAGKITSGWSNEGKYCWRNFK